jgi:F-type H+-transporting ATPase subunit delta
MSKQNSQRISNPYAEAYCTLMMAETKTKSRRMSVTCLTLTCLLLKYPQIVGFLKNPLLTTTQKKEALAKILKQINADQTSSHFVSLIIDRKRGEFLLPIMFEIMTRVAKQYKIMGAEVIVPKELAPEQLQTIKIFLRKEFGMRYVQVNQTIDRTILGGIQIRLGSTLFDGSLKRQLADLQNYLDTNLLD